MAHGGRYKNIVSGGEEGRQQGPSLHKVSPEGHEKSLRG